MDMDAHDGHAQRPAVDAAPSAPLRTWLEFTRGHDPLLLDELLAADAVFHSPVVFAPQPGKALAKAYLAAAAQALGSSRFRVVEQWVGERSAVLEFETELDGKQVNGVDMLWWNEAGKVTRFKVMIRPLSAVQLVQLRVAEALAAARPALPNE